MVTRKNTPETIDEDMLRSVVSSQSAGGSILNRANEQARQEPQTSSDTAEKVPSAPVTSRTRRSTLPDYETTFMKPYPVKHRVMLYVSDQTRNKLSEVVRKVGNGEISLTSYVENILQNHLDTYKEEINRLHKARNENDIL